MKFLLFFFFLKSAPFLVLPQMRGFFFKEKRQFWMLQLDCVQSLLELLTFAPDKHRFFFSGQQQRLQIQPISGEMTASAARLPPGPRHDTPRCFQAP